MNDLPRQKLVEILARYGPSIAQEPRRCEGLLRDYCSGYRREVAVLVSAMKERIVTDLRGVDPKVPREVVLRKLARRLHDNLAIEETAARWAVNSWALALGFLSPRDLETMEQVDPQPAPPAASPAEAVAMSRPAPPRPSSDVVISAKGDGDYENFQAAMRNVTAGGRLLVRPGVYREGLVIDKPVAIIGDGKTEEIILTNADASCVLMRADKATVRGLTLRQEAGSDKNGEGFFAVDIRQGRLTLEDCDITSEALSCIGIHNEKTEPLIRHCRIHNSADSGIYIFRGATATVEDCDIYDNQNVGVAITGGAAPTIKRCSVRDGKNAGIAVWERGAGVIEDCNIFSNAKANIGISEEGNPTLRHCRIYDGENSGVFVHKNGQASLENCEIYNHAKAEVAVTRGGNLTMRGCKLHDGRDSGVFISDEGSSAIEECDIWDNAYAGIEVDTDGIAAVRLCRINRNGSVAISVKEGGTVHVEDCDLTNNGTGPWEAEYGAVVASAGNTP